VCGDATARVLGDISVESMSMTPLLCTQLASALNYSYAGLQYSRQCFLGNDIGQYTALGECDMTCTGSSGICGGACTNSIYNIPYPEGRRQALRSLC
jgi:hypothetical protein